MLDLDKLKKEYFQNNLVGLQAVVQRLRDDGTLLFIKYLIEERKEVLRFNIAEEKNLKKLRVLQNEYEWYSGLVNRIQELAEDLLTNLDALAQEDEDG